MLFFIYAVIGMQVSCHVTSCRPVSLPSVVFSSYPLLQLASVLCLSSRSLVSQEFPSGHVVLLCSTFLLLLLPLASLCLSMCLPLCLSYELLRCLYHWWWEGRRSDLICSGQPASDFDCPRERSLPPVDANAMSCVLWLLPSLPCRCLVK